MRKLIIDCGEKLRSFIFFFLYTLIDKYWGPINGNKDAFWI